MKQKEVAKELGVSSSYISAILRGKRTINKDFAETLNKYFNIDFEEIKRYKVKKVLKEINNE